MKGNSGPIPLQLENMLSKSESSNSPSSWLGNELRRHTRELYQRFPSVPPPRPANNRPSPIVFRYSYYGVNITPYLPEFDNLELLSLKFSRGLRKSDAVYRTILPRIVSIYPNLKTLELKGAAFTNDAAQLVSNLFGELKLLEVVDLEFCGSCCESDIFQLLPEQMPNLKRLRDFRILCAARKPNIPLKLEPIFRGLLATPITKLTISDCVNLDPRSETALRQLINEKHLLNEKFEKLRIMNTHEIFLGKLQSAAHIQRSFSVPSVSANLETSISTLRFHIPASEGPGEKEFLELRNVEFFQYINSFRADLEWKLNPFILKSLKASKVLRRLEFRGRNDEFLELYDLLNHNSSLDHLAVLWESTTLTKDDAYVFLNAIGVCTSRRRLQSLGLQSNCFLNEDFFDRLLDRDLQIREIDLRGADINDEFRFKIVERVYNLGLINTSKRRIQFGVSKIYDYLEFDSKEYVLKLNRGFAKEKGNTLFPTIMRYVHRVVLDDVAEDVVDFVAREYSGEFQRMRVRLGIVNGQYCLHKSSSMFNEAE
ncbi:hypothetical protein HK098_000715 [Nowakowskiella sp. JEL0407]|nr:hypothetical protein HK098_000715 [Nowakowskiella sp. JEL0407]